MDLAEDHILKPAILLHRRGADAGRRERLEWLHCWRRGREARCGDEEGGEGGGEVHCCFAVLWREGIFGVGGAGGGVDG